MFSWKRFLVFGMALVILLSSCRNKELEQANKELDKSSNVIQDECGRALSYLRKEATRQYKAIALYKRAEQLDSIVNSIINREKNSTEYIIKHYDSLAVNYLGVSDGIEKEVSYQTAKNQLLRLEFRTLNDYIRSISGCTLTTSFGGSEASCRTIRDTTYITVYVDDYFYDATVKPNTLSLFSDCSGEWEELSQKISYQKEAHYFVFKTTKLQKGRVCINCIMKFRNTEDIFGACGYNE